MSTRQTLLAMWVPLTVLSPFALSQMPLSSQVQNTSMRVEAAVTSDHALASAAGRDVLQRGGNAIDAAITMAGVLNVVRPHMNGVGGDTFMLYYEAKTKRVYALNGSGRAGSRGTPAFFAQQNLRTVPRNGILTVSVPGSVAAWSDILKRFGTISLADALAPAIRHAEQGFPVSAVLADDFATYFRNNPGDPELRRIFAPEGHALEEGALLKEPDLARTLRRIAEGGADAFYKGEIAAQIAAFMEKEGGMVTAADLASHTSIWTEPIKTTYQGLTVMAMPPPNQGLTLLEMLNAASLVNLAGLKHNTVEYVNTMVSIGKLAFDDRDRYIADPDVVNVPVERLLSPARAKEIVDEVARRGTVPIASAEPRPDDRGDTVFVGVVDKDGNGVSYIQSLFASFGSGRMVPGTGIVLHNRGTSFSLDAAHPNVIAPGKHPFHTLCPTLLFNADGSLRMVLGSPGGDGQPQTILQVLNNFLIFGMTPQAAVDAARWRAGAALWLEPGVTEPVIAGLRAKGHRAIVAPPGELFGGAQMILVDQGSRKLDAAADSRREAHAIAW
jgi:gamma-glutamyltranspeptidase/glutathione hydrolase